MSLKLTKLTSALMLALVCPGFSPGRSLRRKPRLHS